jgi:hypothetical protein
MRMLSPASFGKSRNLPKRNCAFVAGSTFVVESYSSALICKRASRALRAVY